jgi:N-acetylglucosamine malate deacetylase 1
MKIDLLAFAAHPDDAELSCSGTLLKHKALGKTVGIIDLTRGELGTRGTAETRDLEARDSAVILGLDVRENLGMRDGFFVNDEHHQLRIIQKIRQYQPEIILINALHDRHPDHGKGGALLTDAAFLAGLPKIVTELDGAPQAAWRPKMVLQYIQDAYIKPDIVVDISEFWELKLQSIRAFKTQFFNPDIKGEQETYISKPDFVNAIEGRAREFGKYIGATFAEGFTCKRLLGVNNLFDLR